MSRDATDDLLDLDLLEPATVTCHVRIPHWREKHVGYDWCERIATHSYGADHVLCDAHADEARRDGRLCGINGSGRWQ